MPLVEIKDFNASIDNKPFFDQPIKIKKKRMKTDDYTLGNLRLFVSSKII